ncbi:MAG: hypothetical protein C4523_06125 [Myxococcales bacterium]|nr:MAG: hypothetical protein C4523_06125 [Myxococcales bacterium]
MRVGATVWGAALLGALLLVLAVGCGKSSFEEGKLLFDKGMYPEAVAKLEAAKAKNDNFIQAEELIRQAKEKMEEQADKDCLARADNFVEMLSQAKTVETWDNVMQELKAFQCRKLNAKPYIDKAYYRYIAYLAEWDAYPQAVDKFCEFTGCEDKPPRILVREEEITILDENGKEKEETIQQEIPIVEHSIAMEMFPWLVKKDPKNARWFDRYAKFLYDTERYKEALEAYGALAQLEGVGYEVKSRAQLTVDHLSKGQRKPRLPGDNYRFFWIEEVKTKSKLKALRRELEKAQQQRQQAETQAQGLNKTP